MFFVERTKQLKWQKIGPDASPWRGSDERLPVQNNLFFPARKADLLYKSHCSNADKWCIINVIIRVRTGNRIWHVCTKEDRR